MKGFRWLIMFMIFLACIINFLDRCALAYVIQPIQELYHLNNTDFGILSSAFGLSYLFMTFIGGLLVDKYGSRKILTIFSILWSIASACMGLISGFMSLLMLRLLLGIAEGPAFPSLTRVSSDWLPNQEKARALALSLAAIPFSSVIGAPFITNLMTNFGWRAMFLILGILGIVWSVIWFLLFRDDPNQSKLISEQEKKWIKDGHSHRPEKTGQLKNLIKNKQLLMAYLSYFCLGYLLSFSISWLPGYFIQTHHLNLTDVGYDLMIPWLLSTIFILVGGIFSDYLFKQSQCFRNSRSMVIGIAQLCSAICFIPLLFETSLTSALIYISLGLSLGLFPISAFYSLNSDLAHHQAGTSQGLMSACLGLASFIAPFVTGYLSTKQGNFNLAFLVIIILSLGSSVIMIALHRPGKSLSHQKECSNN
jgi:sugar phosphate permease